jgi:hypothetical protein
MNTITITPQDILTSKYGKVAKDWGIEDLFKKYDHIMETETTETIKHYAAWLQHRPNVTASHLGLCRLWFVCETGLAGDHQDQLECDFFS